MKNKTKTTITIAPETHYEVRRLAKLWDIPIAQVWERCCHYAAAASDREDTIGRDTGYEPAMNVEDIATMRQAEAKVEMLKANN